MERYCGTLRPGIRSLRHPWASLDRYVLEIAQLTQIKALYGVTKELSLEGDEETDMQGSCSDPECGLIFLRAC